MIKLTENNIGSFLSKETKDSIVILDREGVITAHNLNAQKLLGKQNLIGERLADFIEVPVDELDKRREDLFKGEKIETFECVLIINNRKVDVLIHSTPLYDKENNIVGIQEVLRALDDDEVLHNTVGFYKEKVKSFLSYFPGVIYRSRTNEKDNLLYLGRYIENITGYSLDAFETGKIQYKNIIYQQDQYCVFKEIKERVESQQVFDFHYRLVRKDQKIIWVRETGQGVYDDNGILKYITGSIFDATHYMEVQKELRKKEHLFKLIFDKTNIGVVLVDIHRNIAKVNGAFVSMIQYSDYELLTKNVADITYTYGENERIFKNGSATTEKQYKRKDGTVFWARVNIVEVADNETNIYYIAFIEDIDDKKRNELELHQKLKLEELAIEISYDLINESVKDIHHLIKQSMYKIGSSLNLDYISLFFTLDKKTVENRIVWKHDKASLIKDERIADYLVGSSEFKEKLFEKKSIIIHDIETCQFNFELDAIARLGIKSLVAIPLFKVNEFLGVVIFASTSNEYEWNKNRVNFFKIISDRLVLTLNKNHFEKQRNELLIKLENKNQELSDFAKVVSHDLKAPLRGISTLINWVKEDSFDVLNQEGRLNINLALERVEKMENLIQGILDFSSLDIQKENSKEANIDEIIDDITHFIIIPSNIQVVKETPLPIIKADEYRIKQVFMNLISNAVKFSDKPKGVIKIGAYEQANNWTFYVKDNGKGIEKKYFEKIFKIFETLNDKNSASGVGLTIVKKIIEKYKGEIKVKSKIGEGTTFIFTIKKQG